MISYSKCAFQKYSKESSMNRLAVRQKFEVNGNLTCRLTEIAFDHASFITLISSELTEASPMRCLFLLAIKWITNSCYALSSNRSGTCVIAVHDLLQGFTRETSAVKISNQIYLSTTKTLLSTSNPEVWKLKEHGRKGKKGEQERTC